MQLTFDFEYCDYTDAENFAPVLKQWESDVHAISNIDISRVSGDSLLNYAEMVDKVIRYYASQYDYNHLRQAMFLQKRLLDECDSRCMNDIGCIYLKMNFNLIDALIYRENGRNREAVEPSDQAFTLASECLSMLQSNNSLDERQIVFVAWTCLLGIKENGVLHNELLDINRSVDVFLAMIPYIEWLESLSKDIPGMQYQIADTYATIAGSLFSNKHREVGEKCYKNAMVILRILSESGGEIYAILALWVQCQYGLVCFSSTGNPSVMLECERKLNHFDNNLNAEMIEKGIVQGIHGLIELQKSVGAAQAGNQDTAIRLGLDARNHLKESMSLLESDYSKAQKGSHYYTTVSSITNQVFNSLVMCLDSLGVILYGCGRIADSESILRECLEALSNTQKYGVSEFSRVVMQAECWEYLALIMADSGNTQQAETYASEAVSIADDIDDTFRNANILRIGITGCSLLAELYLNAKDKTKAVRFSEKGLSFCDRLSLVSPQDPSLGMRTMLEKSKKRASRKFLW